MWHCGAKVHNIYRYKYKEKTAYSIIAPAEITRQKTLVWFHPPLQKMEDYRTPNGLKFPQSTLRLGREKCVLV